MRNGLFRGLFLLFVLTSTTADAAFYYLREGQLARLSPEISYRVEDERAPATFEQVSKETTGWR